MNPILTVSRVKNRARKQPVYFSQGKFFSPKAKFTPKVKIEYKRVVSEFSW